MKYENYDGQVEPRESNFASFMYMVFTGTAIAGIINLAIKFDEYLTPNPNKIEYHTCLTQERDNHDEIYAFGMKIVQGNDCNPSNKSFLELNVDDDWANNR